MLSATVLLPAALVALLASGSVAAMGDDIKGKLIYSFEDDAQSGDWQVIKDTVMGGVSSA